FAQAVVRDAEETAKSVRLTGHFPIPFPPAGYWAITAAVLALLAFVFVPSMDLLGRQKKAEAQREQDREIAKSQETVTEALAKIQAVPKAVVDNESVRIARAELAEMLKHPMPDSARTGRRTMEALEKVDNALKQQAADNKNFAQSKANSKMFKSLSPPVD